MYGGRNSGSSQLIATSTEHGGRGRPPFVKNGKICVTQGKSDLDQDRVKLVPNGRKLGFSKINFQLSWPKSDSP